MSDREEVDVGGAGGGEDVAREAEVEALVTPRDERVTAEEGGTPGGGEQTPGGTRIEGRVIKVQREEYECMICLQVPLPAFAASLCRVQMLSFVVFFLCPVWLVPLVRVQMTGSGISLPCLHGPFCEGCLSVWSRHNRLRCPLPPPPRWSAFLVFFVVHIFRVCGFSTPTACLLFIVCACMNCSLATDRVLAVWIRLLAGRSR